MTASLSEWFRRRGGWTDAWAGLALVLVVCVAYGNSLRGPLIFDDLPSIARNPTLWSFTPPWAPFFPPCAPGMSVSGRPVLNFSLALNYAAGGTAVLGYHLANLTIHCLAGLVLFGIVSRTLRQRPLAARFGAAFRPLALATALLWTLHPLQTEAVTYLIQRAESLMGLFYLLTLYAFIRAAEPGASTKWYILSVGACLLGMGTKEVMASAPALVFLYDRTFVAGTCAGAWRARRKYYIALALTWIALAGLALAVGTHGGTAGGRIDLVGTDVDWGSYALTQPRSVVTYLGLAFWPHPLVFDRGGGFLRTAGAALPYLLPVAALFAGTILALRRSPVLGFLGAWFFLILIPSSGLVAMGDPLWEHRMYLSLAAPVSLAVALLYRGLRRHAWIVLVVLIIACGVATWQRNHTYQSALALWTDTVAKNPAHPRARFNLAEALRTAGRKEEAAAQEAAAKDLLEKEARARVAAAPSEARARRALGRVLLLQGHREEAMEAFTEALRLHPGDPETLENLGMTFLLAGKTEEAAAKFQEAACQPSADGRPAHDLGLVAIQQGRLDEAVDDFTSALRIDPRFAEAQADLGNALLQQRNWSDAAFHLRQATRIDPFLLRASISLAIAYYHQERRDEAEAELKKVLRLDPANGPARALLDRLHRPPAGVQSTPSL